MTTDLLLGEADYAFLSSNVNFVVSVPATLSINFAALAKNYFNWKSDVSFLSNVYFRYTTLPFVHKI